MITPKTANPRILHTQGATPPLRPGSLCGKEWVPYQAGWSTRSPQSSQ